MSQLDEWMLQLDSIRFFEGYSDSAREAATKAIAKNFKSLHKDESTREILERFPGIALAFIWVDDEQDSLSDVKRLLQRLRKESFEMFAPEEIKVSRSRDKLTFTLGGESYEMPAEAVEGGWLSEPFYKVLYKAMKAHCSGLELHYLIHPHAGQVGPRTLCTDRAFRALKTKGLVPKSFNDIGLGGDTW